MEEICLIYLELEENVSSFSRKCIQMFSLVRVSLS
jgi:hypothetical protein